MSLASQFTTLAKLQKAANVAVTTAKIIGIAGGVALAWCAFHLAFCTMVDGVNYVRHAVSAPNQP